MFDHVWLHLIMFDHVYFSFWDPANQSKWNFDTQKTKGKPLGKTQIVRFTFVCTKDFSYTGLSFNKGHVWSLFVKINLSSLWCENLRYIYMCASWSVSEHILDASQNKKLKECFTQQKILSLKSYILDSRTLWLKWALPHLYYPQYEIWVLETKLWSL